MSNYYGGRHMTQSGMPDRRYKENGGGQQNRKYPDDDDYDDYDMYGGANASYYNPRRVMPMPQMYGGGPYPPGYNGMYGPYGPYPVQPSQMGYLRNGNMY